MQAVRVSSPWRAIAGVTKAPAGAAPFVAAKVFVATGAEFVKGTVCAVAVTTIRMNNNANLISKI